MLAKLAGYCSSNIMSTAEELPTLRLRRRKSQQSTAPFGEIHDSRPPSAELLSRRRQTSPDLESVKHLREAGEEEPPAGHRGSRRSSMSIRNKPPPIDTQAFTPAFEWAEDIKPNPVRSAVKFGLALAAFALAVRVLNAELGPMTLLTLRLWPVVYQQDTAIAASDAAAIQAWRAAADAAFAFKGPAMEHTWTVNVPAQTGSSTHTVPVRFYTPTRAPRIGRRDAAGAVSDNASNVVVLLLHGGGWVTGGGQSHDGLASAVAYATGHVVAAPDYRLAPEHCFPAALEDAAAVLAWLLEVGTSALQPQHAPAAEDLAPPAALSVVLAGDGVGGNLAAALTLRPPPPPLRAHPHDGNRVCAAVLAYPLLDPALSVDQDAGGGSPVALKAEHVAHYWDMYLPPTWRERHQAPDGSEYLVAPPQAPLPLLARQPPTLVLSATIDIARDDGESYIEQLHKAAAAAASADGAAPAAAQSRAVRLPRTVRGFFGRRSHEGGATSLKEMKAHIQRHCA
eukprot:TRINITY_DN12717_c0_g1_i1.p1 TRINITY_DN12717_c0_g1~~TRINITY_DN12717_c0_g1_i1.p1  ORF type:complete len:510 (+),score=129.97 TRINITY_DN12717_c0_g1_i1:76-1605(+)